MGYGGFSPDGYREDLRDVMILYLRGVAWVVLPYIACSIWMERIRFAYLPAVSYCLYMALFVVPMLVVMGEFGPAHVALVGTARAVVVFPVLLVIKCLLLYHTRRHRPLPK